MIAQRMRTTNELAFPAMSVPKMALFRRVVRRKSRMAIFMQGMIGVMMAHYLFGNFGMSSEFEVRKTMRAERCSYGRRHNRRHKRYKQRER